jgi:hypothetical protein
MPIDNGNNQRRLNRRQRRKARKFERKKREIIQSNIAKTDKIIADFRKEILELARKSSIGDPITAMSSAMSSPKFTLKLLLLVLDTKFRSRNSVDKERIHFEIKDNTLVIREFYEQYIPGGKTLKDAPRIEVRIGNVQLASHGRPNDHRCKQLQCNDKNHSVTKIVCPSELENKMEGFLFSEEIETQIITEDGDILNMQTEIYKFNREITNDASWQHCVKTAGKDSHNNPIYNVSYFHNEIVVLSNVIVYLLSVLFGPNSEDQPHQVVVE